MKKDFNQQARKLICNQHGRYMIIFIAMLLILHLLMFFVIVIYNFLLHIFSEHATMLYIFVNKKVVSSAVMMMLSHGKIIVSILLPHSPHTHNYDYIKANYVTKYDCFNGEKII